MATRSRSATCQPKCFPPAPQLVKYTLEYSQNLSKNRSKNYFNSIVKRLSFRVPQKPADRIHPRSWKKRRQYSRRLKFFTGPHIYSICFVLREIQLNCKGVAYSYSKQMGKNPPKNPPEHPSSGLGRKHEVFRCSIYLFIWFPTHTEVDEIQTDS